MDFRAWPVDARCRIAIEGNCALLVAPLHGFAGLGEVLGNPMLLVAIPSPRQEDSGPGSEKDQYLGHG
jgi:hypothetical protein